MKYIDSKKLSDTHFKRYTGISWSTSSLMIEQLKMHVPAKGRPPKLSLEDQVLLCLSYWREYRFTDYTHRHSLKEVHELFANSYADESDRSSAYQPKMR